MAELLGPDAIRLDAEAADQETAIRLCGQTLVDIGAVDPPYIAAMLEREQSISTYLGEGVAIPHGTNAAKGAIHRDALAFLKFPEGIDWNGNPVTVCIAIAAQGDRHLSILAELADVLADPDQAGALRAAATPDAVLALLTPSSGGTP